MMREETKINKDMPMGVKFHLLRTNLMESTKKSNIGLLILYPENLESETQSDTTKL